MNGAIIQDDLNQKKVEFKEDYTATGVDIEAA